MVRDSLFSTQRFLDFHAYANTPFWRNMHGDLVMALDKVDMTRYTKGRHYTCDVDFMLMVPRNMFREPQYEPFIAKKRLRDEREDF